MNNFNITKIFKIFFFLINIIIVGKVNAQIPVTDVINGVQNTLTAAESVAQTIQQVEQYRLQLEQYEQQLRNARNLTNFDFSNAQRVIDATLVINNSISRAVNRVGSNIFYSSRGIDYFDSTPCFDNGDCNSNDVNSIKNQIDSGSIHLSQTTQDNFVALDQERNLLIDDVSHLNNLANDVRSAESTNSALQLSNVLAHEQATMLARIQGSLNLQTQLLNTEIANQNIKNSSDSAAATSLRRSNYQDSPNTVW